MKKLIKIKWTRFHSAYLVRPKLSFVRWFDNFFKGKYCWTDCVGWAFDSERFNPFKIDTSKGCEADSRENELCYCGGWKKGVCFAKLSKKEQGKIRQNENQTPHPPVQD